MSALHLPSRPFFPIVTAQPAAAGPLPGAQHPLSIHLLGKPQVLRNGDAVRRPRGNKVWALLAYLLLVRQAPTRRQIADLLFADADDPLGALRWNLSELRRLLGKELARGNPLTLDLPHGTAIDVRLVGRVNGEPLRLGTPLDAPLLEGMSFPSSPAFDVWLAAERRHLQAAGDAVLREAAHARLAAGDAHEAADLAGRLVRRNPLDEDDQALLVRALSASGDVAGAQLQADACRNLLRRELGVQPGPSLDNALHVTTRWRLNS